MIEFEIDNGLLKRLIDSHKKFTQRYTDGACLNCFCFELEQNTLKVYTTEGNRLLRSIIEVNNLSGEDGSFLVEANIIQHLVINLKSVEPMKVTVDDRFLTFTDAGHGMVQQYLLTKGNYPKADDLINNAKTGNKAKITVNKNYFQDLAVLFDKYPVSLELNIDIDNKDCPLLVNTEGWELKQTALIVPSQPSGDKGKCK